MFWAAAGAVAVTYAGFPALLAGRARLRAEPIQRGEGEPAVSIVVAARNEAAVIGDKLGALEELDWPRDRLEVIVCSDGSDDGTDAIVASFADRGVQLVQQAWLGKAAALEAAVAASTGEILVFTDANSRLDADALRHLVAPFADPKVGGVAGNQRYLAGDGSQGAGERSYWKLDALLKQAESSAGDAISATGALYAIRRELFDGVAVGVTDDFYVSTGVVARGYRLVFEPAAVAWEPAAASSGREFDRKVRVMTRGLWGVVTRRELLDPRRHGFYAVQLLWHKVLRRVMVIPLAVLAATAPLLWRRGRTYRVATLGQVALYGAGVAGLVLPPGRGRIRRLLELPAFFCLVNAAAGRAILNVVRGRRIDRWEPGRR
jgi:cellulose synthase/poly-beta-1,6-N-acetylglucosamine synthase-like glycosyltransferase